MGVNVLLLVVCVFAIAVVHCKSVQTAAEESEIDANDVQDVTNGGVDEDDARKKKPTNSKKNQTALSIIAENIAYERLKDKIELYNEKINQSAASTSPVDDRFFAIYPGTKWCGAGNIAFGYNDLGLFRSVDMCCRNHDYCSEYISGYSTKYGLTNNSPISKLLCSCDTNFHSCLKSLYSRVGNNVGNIYFNILGSQCFANDYPIISCKTYYTNTNRCSSYNLNTTVTKKYQYFDTPVY